MQKIRKGTGGRMIFKKDSSVRVLSLDGKISPETYRVLVDRADGMGLVELSDTKNPKRIIKATQRRILPLTVDTNKAIVLQSGGKYSAICPECRNTFLIQPEHLNINCPSHGTFELEWLGAKPAMSDTETAKPADTADSNTASQVQSTVPSTTKTKKTATKVTVDIAAIANTDNCQLFERSSPFNHEQIQVVAYAILFIGEEPRKLCFNTYDGTLGKKKTSLGFDHFLANDAGQGTTWYAVKSLEKERKKLEGKGYKLVTGQ